MTNTPFDLDRFVVAQAPVFESALGQLRAGRKTTHWMWFIFPQLRGLGQSATALYYGISSLEEARAYLDHALLGPRLIDCAQAVLRCDAGSLQDIFGAPDDLKFRSSMTLFAVAGSQPDTVFAQALQRWCDGKRDKRTLRLLPAVPTDKTKGPRIAPGASTV